jgi:hypothetical protein
MLFPRRWFKRPQLLMVLIGGWIAFVYASQVFSTQSVRLTWNASAGSGIVGYNIFFGTASGDYNSSIQVGGVTDAVVSNLTDGVTYYFALSAYDTSGIQSELSSEVSYFVPGVPPPGGISSVQQLPPGPDVAVTWIPGPGTISEYHLYYREQGGSYFAPISVTGANQAIISGLQIGLTYYFAVASYDLILGTESQLTSEVSFTVPTVAAPGAITSIQRSPVDGGVTVAWGSSPDPNAIGYNIYYGLSADGPFWYAGSDAGNQFTIYGLTEGSLYFFQIKAYDGSWQESAPSQISSFFVPLPNPPGPITSVVARDGGVVLTWTPSSSLGVIGYYVYYGPFSGYYFQAAFADTNEVTLSGLSEGQTYYFEVLAYDAAGQLSAPTSEVQYTVVAAPPVLNLQKLSVPDIENVFSITATGTLPSAWTLETSSDLAHWQKLSEGTDSSLNVLAVVSAKPRLFFRLATWLDGIELNARSFSENGLPNSFFITTSDIVPWDWQVEYSEDLQSWNPLETGWDSRVNVAIIYANPPQLFFRLKGD